MPNKTTLLRRIIAGKSYYRNRVAEMDRKCAFYLDQGIYASNSKLRRAFIQTAAIYFKRYNYYLNKISNNEFRKSLQS